MTTTKERMPAFESREALVEPTVLQIFREHGLDPERDMGLRVNVTIWSFHLLGRELHTPWRPISGLRGVMRVWGTAVRRCCFTITATIIIISSSSSIITTLVF